MFIFLSSLPMRRAAALVAVCLFVGTGLAEQLHAALVRHVRCEVHGEWVHGYEVPAGAAAVAPGEDESVAAAPESEGGHDHEHCAASRGVTACVRLPVPSGGRVGFTLAPPVRPRMEPRAAAIPLWSLAPKSSPPLS